MAVVLERDLPAGAEEVCREVMSRLAAASAFRTPNLRRAQGRQLTLVAPHRVAVLSLEDLREERRTPEPKVIGWRFLVRADGETLAACEAIETPTGYRFGGLNEGPLVGGFVEALERVERLAAVQDGRFEPQLLLAPALNIAALWLAERRGRASRGPRDFFGPRDLILPLPPFDLPLPFHEQVGHDGFLTCACEMARAVPRGGVTGG